MGRLADWRGRRQSPVSPAPSDATTPPVFDCFISYRRPDGIWRAAGIRKFLLTFPARDVLGPPPPESRRVFLDRLHEAGDACYRRQTLRPALDGARHLAVVESRSWLTPTATGQPNGLEEELRHYISQTDGSRISLLVASEAPQRLVLPPWLHDHLSGINVLDLRFYRRWLPWWWGARDPLLSLFASVYQVSVENRPVLRQEAERLKRRWWTRVIALTTLLVSLAITALGQHIQRQKTELLIGDSIALEESLAARQNPGEPAPRGVDSALAALAKSRDSALKYNLLFGNLFRVSSRTFEHGASVAYVALRRVVEFRGSFVLPGLTERHQVRPLDGESFVVYDQGRLTQYQGDKAVRSMALGTVLGWQPHLSSGDFMLFYDTRYERWAPRLGTFELESTCLLPPGPFVAAAWTQSSFAVLHEHRVSLADLSHQPCRVREIALTGGLSVSRSSTPMNAPAALSADDRWLAVRRPGSADDVAIIDLTRGSTYDLPAPDRETITKLTFSPDSRYLITGSRQSLTYWLADDRHLSEGRNSGRMLIDGSAELVDIHFDPSGRILFGVTEERAAGNNPSYLAFWSFPDGAFLQAFAVGGPSISVNERLMALPVKGEVQLLQWVPPRLASGISVTLAERRIADGVLAADRIVLLAQDVKGNVGESLSCPVPRPGTSTVLDANTVCTTEQIGAGVIDIAASAGIIATLEDVEGNVVLRIGPTVAMLKNVPHKHPGPTSVAVSSAPDRVAVGGRDRTVHVRALDSRDSVIEFSTAARLTRVVAQGPNQLTAVQHIDSLAGASTLEIYRRGDSSPVPVPGPRAGRCRGRFSTDESLLAVACDAALWAYRVRGREVYPLVHLDLGVARYRTLLRALDADFVDDNATVRLLYSSGQYLAVLAIPTRLDAPFGSRPRR